MVVSLMVVASGLAITPVARAAAAAARLSVSSTWQTGFIAHFTIVNASTVPMTDWRLEFDLPAGESVSHTWSSTLGSNTARTTFSAPRIGIASLRRAVLPQVV